LGAHDLLPTLAAGASAGRRATDDLGIVEDFMTEDTITCTVETPVAVIAERMASERVHRVIVLDDDGCLAGVVTSMDVLKVFPA
jgi:CBS domain-containing protein